MSDMFCSNVVANIKATNDGYCMSMLNLTMFNSCFSPSFLSPSCDRARSTVRRHGTSSESTGTEQAGLKVGVNQD